jgi:hypothetical protein
MGNPEETIVLARGEQARALAEAKVKAQAAEAEQQHVREVQDKQFAIKRRGIEFQLEGKRKEAQINVERRRKEAKGEVEEDEIRAEQELLTLENEQLQVQSESWIQNQESIKESLIIEAGARAEAAAIIQETNSRSASPNLGLKSLTTNEKMKRFLGTPEPEECSQEDYFGPMVFHPSAFESDRPKQALTYTHPVVTTTTIPANNVYVPPPRLSFRAEPPVAPNFPEVSQTFTHAFYNSETITAPANDVNVHMPQLGFRVSSEKALLPPTSSRNQTFVIPDNSVMQSASFAVNSRVSQIPSSTSDNHLVPLIFPRAPQTQTQSMSGPCQGAIPTDSRQKTNRPETVPMTSKPDLIITDQATLPQVPPTSNFI